MPSITIEKILEDIDTLNPNEQDELLSMLLKKRNEQKLISFQTIESAVSNYYGISITELQSETRKHEISVARQILMYLTRTLTKLSSVKIGLLCGNRNHATVLYACSQIEKKILKDEQLRSDVLFIKDEMIGKSGIEFNML